MSTSASRKKRRRCASKKSWDFYYYFIDIFCLKRRNSVGRNKLSRINILLSRKRSFHIATRVKSRFMLYRVAPPQKKKKKKKKKKKTEQSIFQDFALINSYLFSPCWIEHLFLIIISPRSSNLVEKFLLYKKMSNFLWTVIFGICRISSVLRHD